MIKRIYRFLIFLIFISIIPEKCYASDNNFIDVDKNSYYSDAVTWAVRNKITVGTKEKYFEPEMYCTRSQVVTFLWRANGCPEPSNYGTNFTDIEKSSWYYKAVLWAVEKGITTGTSKTTFEPDTICTRAEIVTFLYRSSGSPSTYININIFNDVQSNTWYYKAVLWAVENKITFGTGNNRFEPDKKCDRAQVVTFIYRMYNNKIEGDYINAADYGVLTNNTGLQNSIALQYIINNVKDGTTIYIPSGTYEFAETRTLYAGSCCVEVKSNINIVGDGNSTVLKPTGKTYGGLNMFYFNKLADVGEAIYLENCNFENFMIDSIDTWCEKYTSAGKGFMINLYKNCHWKNIIVKNTDGTGFGMDCPIDCSIINCTAINCGKSATTKDGGASGFGIGYGYSNDECMVIMNCSSINNIKFGYFFEHQGIFKPSLYTSTDSGDFVVINSYAENNYYNFGGIMAMNLTYNNCESVNPILESFYFENSKDYNIINCN